MSGKTCLVTGATSGIGKVTARELAKLGAQVVVTTRDAAKGAATREEILGAAPGATVEVLHGDLSSMKSVRTLGAEFKRRFSHLHVLINNAGAIYRRRETTVDGLERTFATNHLAYFLLTRELLDLLKASLPARIINVASNAHRRGRMNFGDLQLVSGYSGWRAYNQSKLANILFTRELARRLAGTAITANALHPGVVATGFGRGGSRLTDLAFRIGAPFLLSAEKGARTTIYLATSEQVSGRSGGYYVRGREEQPSPAARDDDAGKRLWDESERMLARILSS